MEIVAIVATTKKWQQHHLMDQRLALGEVYLQLLVPGGRTCSRGTELMTSGLCSQTRGLR